MSDAQQQQTATWGKRDRGDDPLKGMSLLGNVLAWLDRQGGAGAPYTEDHFRLQGRTDFLVATLVALLFIGSFLGFIAWLAATR